MTKIIVYNKLLIFLPLSPFLGYFDLIVSTDFKGPAELSKFVREDLGNIHGLVSHETMVCLETTKDDFAIH